MLIASLIQKKTDKTRLILSSECKKIHEILEVARDCVIAVTREVIGDFGSKVSSIVGVIDCSDILAYAFSQELFEDDASRETWWPLFLNTSLNTLLAMSAKQNSLVYFTAQNSIVELAQHFADGGKKAFLIDQQIFLNGAAASSTLDIISPLGLLEYLYLEQLPILTHILRKQLVCSEKRLVALRDSDTALAGFKAMEVNNIHCIPVISSTNFLISISAKDICSVTNPAAIERLSTCTVSKFLAHDKSKGSDCHLSTDATVEQAINLMVARKCNHVWILDISHQVKGVVTPTDIFRLFAPALAKEA